MAALEDGLRGLARELPSSHAEIAAVAEAAGQLGIETPNVLGFTRTMIDMGQATNLSAEEAATSLARFMNVMGTSQADVGRLGATVVGLGNNFATTESEIVAMSQRLSGAGAQAGLTEGDVMGMATAMSSVGIEAEAGGSAMSQTMKRIGKAVDEGGESLDLFAQVSGVTSEQFVKAWKDDPAMALDGFVNGLSIVEEQGMTTNGVLTELGITGIRESDSLLRLSAASSQGADGMSLLASAVQMGNEEFDKGTALIEEASKRYETAESRIAIAKNALVDMGISIGGVVLPALADLAESAGDVAGWFADLPEPVQQAAAGLGAVVGGASLAAGSFLLLFPRVMDTVQAFQTLKNDMPGISGKLGAIGKAAGVAGVALAGIAIVDGFRRSFIDAGIGADEFTASLINLAETSDITRQSFDELYAETLPSSFEVVKDFGSAMRELDADGFTKFADELSTGFGLLGDSVRDELLTTMDKVDQTVTSFANAGSLDHMADQFNAAAESAAEYGYSTADVLEYLPSFKVALSEIATAAGMADDDTTLLKIATGELVPVMDEATGSMSLVEGAAGDMGAGLDAATGEVEEQVDALAELQDLLQGTSDLMLGVRGSARGFEDAIKAASDAVEENGATLDITTEKGRANEAALDGIASATQDWANSAEEAGASAEELDGIMSSGRDSFIESAEAMGMSKDEAKKLADEMQLIPSFVETEIAVDTEQAITGARDVADVMLDVVAEPHTATIDADTGNATRNVYGFGEVLDGTTEDQLVIVDADTYYGEEQLRKFQIAVNDAGGTVDIDGETMNAEQALAYLVGEVNAGEGVVTIDGSPVDAIQALNSLSNTINNDGGTVTIDGDPSKANSATDSTKRRIDGTGGTVEIDGNNNPANSKTDAAKRKADGTTGTLNLGANTSSAEASINRTARPRSSSINASAATGGAESALNRAARTRTARINVSYSDPGFKGGGGSSRFATGGPVHGPGTGTSDSVPALLSNGEHVLTAAEVARAGGQDAIYRMRAAINSGLGLQRVAQSESRPCRCITPPLVSNGRRTCRRRSTRGRSRPRSTPVCAA